MFENISQGLFTIGGAGYLIVVPALRFLAALFMALSTYKLLKARQDKHKALWLFAIVVSPFFARLAYEVYRRWIAKKEIPSVKGSTAFLIISMVTYILSAVFTVIFLVSMGIGYIKSVVDGEPLDVFYDVHGNEYYDAYDVPLHDKEGNTYIYESAWFSVGNYTDQYGNTYDGDHCYLSEDGYFYYDARDELIPYADFDRYYTDGETVYYSLFDRVYWEEDGTIYDISGRFRIELFDFDK